MDEESKEKKDQMNKTLDLLEKNQKEFHGLS